MLTYTCPGCGQPFFPDDPRMVVCKKDCGRERNPDRNAVRDAIRERHDVEFIGVDGEGVTREDGHHDYVLISVGDQSISDPERLPYWKVFNFLYSQYLLHRDAAFIGFFLGYDFTQWLRTMPEERVRMLLTSAGIAKRQRTRSGPNTVPFPVEIRDERGRKWEYDLLGNKRFKLRPAGVGATWMYICDTGPFWQCSFLKAIDPKGWQDNPILTDEEHAIILEGKEKRATAQLDADMVRYNVAENIVLARLTKRLNEGFTAIGLRLKRDQWFGPGQVASAWLASIKAPLGDDVRAVVPSEIMEAGRCSYYGGWFEIQAHGHIPGPVYEYDINSAYPAEIASLPCFLHGDWTSGDGPGPLDGYTLARVHMRGRNRRTGVHPHRLENGSILRPHESIGWVWGSELRASIAAGLISDFDVLEWHHYEPCACPPPMASIAELYERRLQVGKNSLEGKALKLVYNSAYGKFAQSIGAPKYANALYASLITSGCRSRILDAIGSHPSGTRSLVMVATDGIYFRDPHPGLDIDPGRLGAWDSTQKENMTLLMPGVYWDDKDRARIHEGKAPALKSRGINAQDLARQLSDLDELFRTFDGETWPTLELSVAFSMVSCKQAIQRGKWETAGSITQGGSRQVSSFPGHKRMASTAKLDDGVWRTQPWGTLTGSLESVPYERRFGAELLMSQDDIPLTEDAPDVDSLWHWAVHGEV